MSLKTPKKNLKDESGQAEFLGPRYFDCGAFRLDTVQRELRRDGALVPLTAKAFDTLLLLVKHSGELVEKSEIMKSVWPDSFVEEGNVSVTVHMLRKALGDDTSPHRYI